MGRPKDTFNSYTTEGEKDGKAIKKCIFCGHPFSKDGSVTRIKAHLGNVKGQGVAPCAKVPSDVKKAAKNAMPSSSSNTLNTDIPSNSEMQQPSPQIMQSAPEQSPRLPDGSLQQSNVDPMDVQPNPLLEDTTQQPPPQRSGASGPPPPQNMQLDIPMQQDNAEQFDPLGMGAGDLGCESLIEETSNLFENFDKFLLEILNDPHDCMEVLPQPMQQHPREPYRDVLDQELLQGAAGMDSEQGAATSPNLLQRQACPDSSPDSTRQDDLAIAQIGDHEGLRSQNHMQENLQGDQRIISLHDPFTSIEQRWHNMNTDPLPESSDTPRSTSDQAKRNKRKHGNHPSGKKLPVGTLIEGSTFNKKVDKICEFLEDGSVSKIGIYGMGGCGKTTIMKHIHNQLLEGCFLSYSNVIWVRVPQDCTISWLQNHLVSALELTVPPYVDEEDSRAAFLYEKMQKITYALVLDNVWNEINLAKVGIPEPTRDNGCKLMLTTRSLDVCKRMQCECIKLDVLPEEEAWDLFVKILNVDPRESPIRDIMKKVAKKCAGLPLAIVTVAKSMRSANGDHEWRNALKSLSNRNYDFIDEEEEIMKSLKFSYDRLEEPFQKCLLNCTLYPEDMQIEEDELIELLIMEGTIGIEEGRKSAYDLGQTILDKLERASLLTRHHSYSFIMHDLIRGMCLNIIGNRFVVKSRSKLPPDLSEYGEDVEKVSLMVAEFKEIPSQMVKCPKLSTLLLQCNRYLLRISCSFFEGLLGLKVLNLSNTSIEELPSSVTNLLSLNALVLQRCGNLRFLPCLAPLKALKQLDLYHTAIEEAPEGLEELVNLTYLDLDRTNIEKVSSSVLTNLVKLQLLKLPYGTTIMMKDVKKFKKLEVIKADFANWEEFKEVVNNEQGLSKYKLGAELTCAGASHASMSCRIYRPHEQGTIGATLWLREDHNTIGEYGLSSEVIGQIPSLEIVRHLWLRGLRNEPHQRETKENGELKGIFGATVLFPFSNLVELSVGNLDFTKDLISASSLVVESSSSPKVLPCFQNLEKIEIFLCKRLESILVSIANPIEKEESNKLISFPNLHYLILWGLPNLRSIYDGTLIFPSIKYIMVYDCPKLKRLPLLLPLPPVLDNNNNSGQLSNSSLKVLPCFQNLRVIDIRGLNSLESIFIDTTNPTEKEESNNPISFPNLHKLTLCNLSNLRSIYDGTLICPSIEYIWVRGCPKLKRLPLQVPTLVVDNNNNNNSGQLSSLVPPLSSLKYIEGEWEWWESLEWDQPHAKSLLQPYFRPLEEDSA